MEQLEILDIQAVEINESQNIPSIQPEVTNITPISITSNNGQLDISSIDIDPINIGEEIEALLRLITAITDPEESIQLMKHIFLNFDTSPHLYTKRDYFLMLICFYKHFKYFIDHTVLIVTSWGSPLSDTKVPSEKLVKNTIDNLEGLLWKYF